MSVLTRMVASAFVTCLLGLFQPALADDVMVPTLNSDFTHVYDGTHTSFALVGGRSVEADSEKSRTTVSYHHGTLLYIVERAAANTDTPEPNRHIGIYDGVNTYGGETTDGVLFAAPGLRYEYLFYIPEPGADVPYLPLLQGTVSADQNQHQGAGKMLMSGAFGAHREPVYLPANVHFAVQDNRIKLLDCAITDPEFKQEWLFARHQMFDGAWIASEITFNRYAVASKDKAAPLSLRERFHFRLVSASPKALEDTKYGMGAYLKPHQWIEDTTGPKKVVYAFDPKAPSLSKQRDRALILNDASKPSKPRSTPAISTGGMLLVAATMLGLIGRTILWHVKKSS